MSFRKRFKYEVDALNVSTLRGDLLVTIYSVFPIVHLFKVFVYRNMGGFLHFFSVLTNEMCTSFEPVVSNILI